MTAAWPNECGEKEKEKGKNEGQNKIKLGPYSESVSPPVHL